eukprot:3058154-Pleurochrysis_carterae.AAC.1
MHARMLSCQERTCSRTRTLKASWESECGRVCRLWGKVNGLARTSSMERTNSTAPALVRCAQIHSTPASCQRRQGTATRLRRRRAHTR